MKKILLCIVAALFIFNPLLMSCAKSDDGETNNVATDRMTENDGEEMADRITAPIEKARNAKELVEKNYRDMEENLNK